MLKATDSAYLRYQYDDSTKLRVRSETHRLYSAGPVRLAEELLRHLHLRPGLVVLDVGCGPGSYHAAVALGGASVVGVDTSLGMVREARAPALGQRYPASVAQADAQALPFANASFDRALAAHILYHVPDRVRALRELRRVLRPGGRVVLVTNGANYLSRLSSLHREAALALGYHPTQGDGDRFTMDDLALVQEMFPTAERHVLHNALVFHEAEPLLRYYASGAVDRLADRPSDGSHRPKLLSLVRERAEVVIQREGVFRDPKAYGFFVAAVP